MILLSTFLAGAAALAYEVLWVRLTALSFGNTAPAVTAVLAAFMGGLAAGSWAAGQAADRRAPGPCLRLYAAVELAAAALALASRPVLLAVGRAALAAGLASLPPSAQAAVAFALSAAFLSVPAALMGASLPLLVRALAGAERPDAPLALVYGANTAGAVAGCAATGLWLLPSLGLKLSLAVGAGLDAAAAALAWRAAGGRGEAAPPPASLLLPAPAAPLALLAATGAAAMACEAAWTRALALLAGSTTYAFTAVLAVLLAGLAAGSLAYTRRRPAAADGLGVLLLALSALVLAGLAGYDRLPYLFVKTTGGRWPVLGPFAFALLLIGPPSLLMGAVLPWAAGWAAPPRAGLGRAIGGLYAANTAGAIAGSALAGLVLLPAIGWRGALAAAAALYALCAAALLAAAGRRAAAAAALLPALLAPAAARGDARLEASGMFLYAPHYAGAPSQTAFARELARDRVIFDATGRNATVTVLEAPAGQRYLRVNGKTDASEGGDLSTQLLLGVLPRLWGPPAPRRALVVGLGAGQTAAALADERSLAALDVVEIEPEVARAARLFARSNRRVLDDPRLRLVFADARQWLAAPGPAYDLIVSEPSNPWIAGVAYLYTREAFALARARLAPGGVFCQWFHSYFMRPEDFRLVARTFAAVFPHAALLSNGEADYFLVGSERPLVPDYARFEAAVAGDARLRDDLARVGLGDPFVLLTGTYVLGDDDLRRWAGPGPLHVDDRPTLETDAPLSFQQATAGPILASLDAAKAVLIPPGTLHLPDAKAGTARLFARAAGQALDAEDAAAAAAPAAQAVRLGPRVGAAWTAYGRWLDAVGRKREAEAALRRGAALDPGSPDARARLGLFLYAKGEPAKGRPELEAARRLLPGDPLACLGLGWMDLERGDKAAARVELADALSHPVPDGRLRGDLAAALAAAERP